MNVYERIFNIVNLLKEVETGISINKISEILDIRYIYGPGVVGKHSAPASDRG